MVSIIIPVFNEQETVKSLMLEISKIIKPIDEVIFVNDGSDDDTLKKLKELKQQYSCIVIVNFDKRYGQTAAMDAGLQLARHTIAVTLDGDLQNDPADIPTLIGHLNNYDLVNGWRKYRKDKLSKKIASRFAYALRFILAGDRVHDSGCTLKVYRTECFRDLHLTRDMHRFIPLIFKLRGYSVKEVIVSHRPRKAGKTKYGNKRFLRGIADLINILLIFKFKLKKQDNPVYVIRDIIR